MSTVLLSVLLLLLLQASTSTARSDLLHPNCQEYCGNSSVPYPFGIGKDCARDSTFSITCKKNDEGVLRPHLGGINSRLQVSEFSVAQNQATMLKHLSYDCYVGPRENYGPSGLDLTGTPFAISASRNKFTAIGCNTIAYINGTNGSYVSGCMSFCKGIDSATDGSCAGVGCCQTSLPENLVEYKSAFYSRKANDTTKEFNLCSFSFVVDQDWFDFKKSYLSGDELWSEFKEGVPLALDWVAGSIKCEEAKKNSSSYACRSNNSICLDTKLGYGCNCTDGYEGNPYLENGCQDINECDYRELYPCRGICANREGSYSCSCPLGSHSQNPKEIECIPDPGPDSLPLWIKVTLGIGIFIIASLILSFSVCIVREKRKHAKDKEKFFKQNGGFLLYEELKSRRESVTFKIYSKEELEKATNNFDKSRIVGLGGQGTVYRGILEDNKHVAIKRAKTIDNSQKEEFIKEILILSQINHTNVVKLLGCCLEVEIPMLVYEFVTNGTLYKYIQDRNHRPFIPLDTRLRVAAQSAEALAYLHSSASPPILHRDVKSSNILLDEDYVAKVSDFGASILVANDEIQLATVLQGTLGYLDPEYMQTYVFTEKSDVYGFGVVLLELLTRKKAIYFEGSKEEKNLASSFISFTKQDRLMEYLDDQLINEGQEEVLQEISELAMQCLSLMGQDRPTMKEVADKLQSLRRFMQHPLGKHNSEESETLLVESSFYNCVDTTEFFSLDNTSVLHIEAGRG